MRLVKNPSHKHSKEILESFNKLKAHIHYKDHTQYNGEEIKKIIDIAMRARDKFKLKSSTISWLTKVLIDDKNRRWQEFEKNINILRDSSEPFDEDSYYLDFNFGRFEYYSPDNQDLKYSFDEDYLTVLAAYEKNKRLLPDISKFYSIEELSQSIENLNANKLAVSDETLDIFFEFDGWFIAMPHTTQASCFLGKQTSWCTARTKSENYFRRYVGTTDANVILFYLIKVDGNPLVNPMDKISIGFIDCFPKFPSDMTVDAANNKLTRSNLEETFGRTVFNMILDEMTKKCNKIIKHPLKTEMEALVKDRKAFRAKLDSIENEMEKESFINQASNYEGISGGVILEIVMNAPIESSLNYNSSIMATSNFAEDEIKEIIDNIEIVNHLFLGFFFKYGKLTKKMVLYALQKKASSVNEYIHNLSQNNLIDNETFQAIFDRFKTSRINHLGENNTLTTEMAIKLLNYTFDERNKFFDEFRFPVITSILNSHRMKRDMITSLIPYIYKLKAHEYIMQCISFILTKAIFSDEIIYTLINSANDETLEIIIVNNILGETGITAEKLIEIIDTFDGEEHDKRGERFVKSRKYTHR